MRVFDLTHIETILFINRLKAFLSISRGVVSPLETYTLI